MADPKIYTPDTLIRKLGFTTRKKLARVLDAENELLCDWRKFALLLPRKPGSTDRRYNSRDIQSMSQRQRSGKSPTESILSDIGTLNMTVGHIVEVFEEMSHLEAIEILLPDHPSLRQPGDADPEDELVPDFAPDKIQEFSVREVAALTANFNEAPVANRGRQIGEGGFGMVFLGYFKKGQKCAVKRLYPRGDTLLDPVRTLEQLRTEAITLMNLQHANLVKIYGYCLDNYSIVLEYISGGDLKQRLACKHGGQPLSWKSRLSIATGVARGISFMHEGGYIHRDIKSANILLDGNLVPKIADFGLVRKLPDDKTREHTSMVYITIVYQAPEIRGGEYSKESDTYSFGVVLLEIITGMPVFDKDRDSSDIITFVEDEVLTDDMILKFVDKKSGPYINRQVTKMFMTAKLCLKHRRDRPTMHEVYEALNDLCQ